MRVMNKVIACPTAGTIKISVSMPAVETKIITMIAEFVVIRFTYAYTSMNRDERLSCISIQTTSKSIKRDCTTRCDVTKLTCLFVKTPGQHALDCVDDNLRLAVDLNIEFITHFILT